MKNLEASWKEKTDFWVNNAINYVYSIAYKCFKEREHGICTLLHVIAFALSDSDLVFHWLSEDPEIALNMSSMLTAWKLGVQQQVHFFGTSPPFTRRILIGYYQPRTPNPFMCW